MSLECVDIDAGKIKKNDIHFDKSLFTFKPKLNPKSTLIAAQGQSSFMERQNSHNQKQLELLRKAFLLSTNDYGKLLYPFSILNNTELVKSDILTKGKV